jgi:lipid-binding SYLF domain-containing protein
VSPFRTVVVGLCAFALSVLPATAQADDDPQSRRLQQASEVLREFAAIPENAIPSALLARAYGVAVIPSVIKVGFIVGARRGRGVLVVRQDNGEWSNPAFITLTGGSLGWQIGGQSTDVVLVFKSSRSVEGITSGTFTLGADASVAAGPVGRQTGAATDTSFAAEVYSYSRNRGLFAGVALDGSAIQIDDTAARDFYGNDALTAVDVLGDPGLRSPAAARQFIQALDAIAPPPVAVRPPAPARTDEATGDPAAPEEEARTFRLEEF